MKIVAGVVGVVIGLGAFAGLFGMIILVMSLLDSFRI